MAKPGMGWRLVYAIKLVEAVHVGAVAVPKLLGARKSEASFGDNLPGEAILVHVRMFAPARSCSHASRLQINNVQERKRALASAIA